MEIRKALEHLPITNSSSEKDKPEPRPCEHCGTEKPQLFLEIPLIGKRWVYAACPCEKQRQEEWDKEQAQREKNHHIKKLLHLSSSIEQLRKLKWETLKVRKGMETSMEAVKDAVKEFKERGNLGVFLFGESGNGKTHITAAGANELLDLGYSVIFLTEKDLLSRFRETDHFNNDERFFEIMNACLEADLLVWDDFLSSQKLDKKEKDWIFQVVNGRERANKPIWYTSNITPDEFSSGKYAKVLDDKERTWWRIIGNNVCLYNRASNFRRIQAFSRTKGIPIEQLEDE